MTTRTPKPKATTETESPSTPPTPDSSTPTDELPFRLAIGAMLAEAGITPTPQLVDQFAKLAEANVAELIEPDPEPELPPRNVIEGIARVMAKIGGIRKLTTAERESMGLKAPGAGEQGVKYAYRSIDQLAQAAQPLFGRYGVVLVPTVTNQDVEQIIVNNNPWTETTVWVRYDIYGPGGVEDKIVSIVTGVGRDNSDKGVNKAMTGAFKNLLLRMLCVGDPQDDPDNERHETSALGTYRDPSPDPMPPHPSDVLFDRIKAVAEAHPAVAVELKAWADGKKGLKAKALIHDDWRIAVENKLDELLAALPQTTAEDENQDPTGEPPIARTTEEVAEQLAEVLGATEETDEEPSGYDGSKGE